MNKKGCIIALIVVVVLAALGIGGCLFMAAKYGADLGNAGAAFAVEAAIDLYRSENPDEEVPVTNEAWAAKLKDFDLPGGGGDGDLSQFIQGGKIVDIFKNEMKLEEDANGKIRVTSPGKDGQMDTDDDVTSELFQKFQQKIEDSVEVEQPETPELAPEAGGTE